MEARKVIKSTGNQASNCTVERAPAGGRRSVPRITLLIIKTTAAEMTW
jgi:hypothetical protein